MRPFRQLMALNVMTKGTEGALQFRGGSSNDITCVTALNPSILLVGSRATLTIRHMDCDFVQKGHQSRRGGRHAA
jgi:hypothetical protein